MHSCLLRRLKRLDPTLHRHTFRYIYKMSKKTKRLRTAYCQARLAKGQVEMEKHLARVVWVDAKKLYACPQDHGVYAPYGATTAGGLLVEDARLPKTPRDVKRIMYYAAVNNVLGACHFKICTGTTTYSELCKGDWGKKEGLHTYKVRGWVPASNV